jgi:PAS domain S-box-containing protein
MNDNDPDARLKNLEIELNDLQSLEVDASIKKEMLFRKAIENAVPSGITVMDDTGRQVYVNKAFCKMVGWDEDQLLGKRPPFVYWAPDDMEHINNAVQQTLNNNAPEEGFDLVFCQKTGKLINVHVIISPFVQEDERTFFLANVIDITQRKKTEEDLITSKLLLSSSIESQKDAIIFSIDKHYNYLYFNKAHSDSMRYAYNQDVKIGMNILDCISSDDDKKLAKKNYDRALKGESHSQIQAFGEINAAYYESFFNPILNEQNEIIGCTGLARNITERKQSENALIESEKKFKEIIYQINDGIIAFDEEGKICIWNKGAENISGLKANETINRNIVDVRYQFTPPEIRDRARIENTIKAIVEFQTPEMFSQIVDDNIISLNPPHFRNVQSTVFPIKLEGYNLFCAVIRDTTELKRYEKELLQISEEKDKFYSVIAQYLYTPFNLFHNFTKLMAEELDTLPLKEIQKMAKMMSKSTTNLYSLLDNMLQWTRMNQGKIAFEPQKLNFIDISRDAVSILKSNAEAKNITINHYAQDNITVYADIFMFKAILRNLVSNAIKFTDEGGEINISAEHSASGVTISVKDNGIGIAPDYITNIFNISHIHKTLGTSEEKGTTLGLLLCKEFVEKHGGKIWVESENNKGSNFKFTLPLYSEQLK